ncbi:TPA: type I toxin-antitoxin system toxin Ldr family protein, partial [Escherichia coli]|nr:small toxic polypeptide LdrA/LdrC [Escherichia coli]EHY3429142.1 type I toxin-antitoxin system toxin Ldr family protein [Escherichia coli]EJJ5426855.1 type I toxin-antitoxin system toxin Ldr family protein [Escherichia coli]HBV0078284.1 type I toxin-antitoxin system toxin Ldr family protein [Escherichia coli]HCN8125005.1 type I toxin-antitoxin system toxin Ldr family protein [Escherichia coli]
AGIITAAIVGLWRNRK